MIGSAISSDQMIYPRGQSSTTFLHGPCAENTQKNNDEMGRMTCFVFFHLKFKNEIPLEMEIPKDIFFGGLFFFSFVRPFHSVIVNHLVKTKICLEF